MINYRGGGSPSVVKDGTHAPNGTLTNFTEMEPRISVGHGEMDVKVVLGSNSINIDQLGKGTELLLLDLPPARTTPVQTCWHGHLSPEGRDRGNSISLLFCHIRNQYVPESSRTAIEHSLGPKEWRRAKGSGCFLSSY